MAKARTESAQAHHWGSRSHGIFGFRLNKLYSFERRFAWDARRSFFDCLKHLLNLRIYPLLAGPMLNPNLFSLFLFDSWESQKWIILLRFEKAFAVIFLAGNQFSFACCVFSSLFSVFLFSVLSEDWFFYWLNIFSFPFVFIDVEQLDDGFVHSIFIDCIFYSE